MCSDITSLLEDEGLCLSVQTNDSARSGWG
jgi:hypothetical protein